MKLSPWLRASMVFLLVGIATAQRSTEAEVPVENEPHHHLVFENEYVRVFKVEVAPHEATLVHRHKRDYVVVTIGDAEVTNAVVGKDPKKWNFNDGDVTFLEATGEKSFAHKAVNGASTPFLNYTIEIKTGRGVAANFDRCEGTVCHRSIASGEGFVCETFRNPNNAWALSFPGKLTLVVVLADSGWFGRVGAKVKKYDLKWFDQNQRFGFSNSLACFFDPIKATTLR
jgi:hypothetical protein